MMVVTGHCLETFKIPSSWLCSLHKYGQHVPINFLYIIIEVKDV